jgi:chromosomal replication initiator protein
MTPTIDQIIAAVVKEYHYSRAEILGPRRFVELVKPRHIAMWLAVNYSGLGIGTVSRKFKRDHSTVYHAVGKVEGDAGLRLEAGVLGTMMRGQ